MKNKITRRQILQMMCLSGITSLFCSKKDKVLLEQKIDLTEPPIILNPSVIKNTYQYTVQPRRISFDDLKKKNVTPSEYLADLEQGTFDIVDAHNKGILISMIYLPKQYELVKILNFVYEGRAKNNLQLKQLIETAVDEYQWAAEEEEVISLVLPSMETYAQQVPHIMVFFPEMLNQKNIQKEADILSTIKHEIQHIKDDYYGILFEGLYIGTHDYNLYDPGPNKIRQTLIKRLMEFRASHLELQLIQKEISEKGTHSVSETYYLKLINQFSDDFIKLNELDVKGLEVTVRNKQLEEVGDINFPTLHVHPKYFHK